MREALREPLVKSITRQITQTAHGFAILAPVYFNGVSWVLANASAINTSNVMGIVTRIIDANRFEITVDGYFKLITTSGSLAANTVLYLTASGTVGDAPIVIGHVKKQLIIGESSSSGTVSIGEGQVLQVTPVTLNNSNATTILSTTPYNFIKIEGILSVIRSAGGNQIAAYTVTAVKGGDGTWLVAYEYVGQDIYYNYAYPSWDVNISALQVTLPNITSFTSASFTYNIVNLR